MKDILYNKILNSIDKEVCRIINEQFNIGNMDLNNKRKPGNNIFNKVMFPDQGLCDNILENIYHHNINRNVIKQLNDHVATAHVCSREELDKIVKLYLIYYRNDSLNWIDVSDITDMSQLFNVTNYNGDISKWDVSNVTDMESMFANSYFKGDISEWNVSKVTNMKSMFFTAPFNMDISKWDVSNVTNMKMMFQNSTFNQDISKWDVSNVRNMEKMFCAATHFNQDISGWDVSNVVKYNDVFIYCDIRENYKPMKFR